MSPPVSLPDDYTGLDLDFHTLANHIPQLAWMTQPDGYVFWYNRPWYEYTGTTPDQVRGDGWKTVMHPDHRERVKANFNVCLLSHEPWEDSFPLRSHDGEWRWFLSRAAPIHDNNGNIVRWLGTNTDITEQKEIEYQQKRLLHEVDHRAKNGLAVAQAVVKLSTADTINEYKNLVESRIAALSRAHMLLADSQWQGVDLRMIINGELSARTSDTGHVDINGENVRIDSSHGQSLALLFNELITNAEKYGALRNAKGKLSIQWQVIDGNQIEIEWIESGPEEITPSKKRGFGAIVTERIVRQQLSGKLESRWDPQGIAYQIRLPGPRA